MSSADPIELVEAFERRAYQNLCPNRIWHAWQAFSRSKDGPSHLLELLKKYGATLKDALKHEDHSACNFDFCEFSSRNFTAVQQYHERRPYEEEEQTKIAENHKKTEVCFPLQGLFNDGRLAEAVQSGGPTAWTLDGSAILPKSRPFMAISHVWSDGTGTGTWPSKQVNECLYSYFKGVAERFQCEGIWWDTLCIPQDRNSRSKALKIMHLNYEQARVTLVHDRFLRSLAFQKPDLACLAIVMSPWFTRGWTALELAKSRRVKIIFKDSIKDLDQDILHKINENAAAKKAINKLRQGQISGIEDLLVTLGPRYTSWLKDRAAIAGLLIGIDILDSNKDTFQLEIYQNILKKLQKVSHNHLFHKSITMSEGFSWCATSLFQLPQTQDSPTDGQPHGPPQQHETLASTPELTVNKNGEVVGVWKAFPLEDIDHQKCVWGNSHRLIEAKLRAALEAKSKHCLLVVPPKEECEGIKKGILVEVLRTCDEKPSFKCQFIGSLYFHPALGPKKPQAAEMTIGNTKDCKLLEENENAWDIINVQSGAFREEKKKAEETCNSTTPESEAEPKCSEAHRTGFELHLAAEQGDAKLLNQLLKGHDVHEHDSNGQTPLHRAMWGGSLEAVMLLLEHGADAEAQDSAGNTALHIAADVGFEEAAKHLCDLAQKAGGEAKAREMIQLRGKNDLTPLHYGAISGQYEIAELLVKWNAIIDAQDDKIGWTPLHCAAENGQVPVVKLLLNKGAGLEKTDDKVGWTPLHLAAMNGHRAVVEELVSAFADKYTGVNKMDKFGWTPLLFAAINGDRAVVKELVRNGAKINSTDFDWTSEAAKNHEAVVEWIKKNGDKFSLLKWTRLHLAAIDWRTGTTRSLVDGDMDIDTKLIEGGDSLLHWAAGDGRNGTVSFLVRIGADIEAKDSIDRTPLSRAAEKGHEAIVRLLAELGADVEGKGSYGQTPLWWAAAYGREAVMRLLVEKGADTEAKDSIGRTPLLRAAAYGREAVVRLLAEKGANIEAKDSYGQTPLSRAAENGHEAVVRLLVEKGANIETKDSNGRTPLWWAAENGREAVVRLLVERGADVEANSNSQTPLWRAAEKGHEAVVRLLVEKDANIETKDSINRTPLWRAAAYGREAVVWLLAEKGANIEAKNSYGQTPLSRAAEDGREAVIRLLVEKGADTETKDSYGRTPLLRAAEKGHEAVVRLLVELGANIEAKDSYGQTPLWWAAENGREAIVRLLVEKGVNIEAKDSIGRTTLWWAAAHGREAVVRLLAELGADVEANSNSQAPLWRAAEKGHEAVVRLLVELGANIEANSDGQTPLSRAAAYGREAVVWLLADKGANIEAKDSFDQTPLSRAAEDGHEAVVRLLVEKGANIETKDSNGRTPLWWAAENGREAVVRLLVEKGANIEAKDSIGRTTLWRAAEKGHEAVVRLLVELGANRQMPLIWALKRSIAKFL